MEDGIVGSDFNKAQFAEKCSSCPVERIEEILDLIEDSSGDKLSSMLQSLSLISERGTKKLHSRIYSLVRKVLRSTTQTRADRKAVLAVLDNSPLPYCNDDIVHLLESLEEPQMHIVIPFLSRFPRILNAVKEEKLPFAWAETILIRALLHTNGWIRCWAIETAIDIDISILRDNYGVLMNWIIPSLSASDLLWRLVDKDILESFYDKLTNILTNLSQREMVRDGLVLSIIDCLSSLTCPVSTFLFIRTLSSSIPSFPLLDSDNHSTMRECMVRISTISQLPLRLVAFTRMVKIFSGLYILENPNDLLSFFGSLIRLISPSHRFDIMNEVLSSFSVEIKDQLMKYGEMVESTIDQPQFEVEEWYLLLSSSSIQIHCDNISLSRRIASFSISNQYDLDQLMDELVRSNTAILYLELARVMVKKHSKKFDICKSLINAMEKYKNEQFLLSISLLAPLLDEMGEMNEDIIKSFMIKYPIYDDLPSFSPTCSLERKEKIVLREEAEVARLIIGMKGKDLLEWNENLASFALGRVYEASLYNHKEHLILLLSLLINNMSLCDIDTTLWCRIIQSGEDVMNEEKKSSNYLPALNQLLHLSFNILNKGELLDEITNLLIRLVEYASLNTSIAVLVSRSILDNIDSLPLSIVSSPQMCSIIVQLAIFGPIPKKEVIVLHRCMKMVYNTNDDEVNDNEEIRLHECTFRTRLYGIMSAIALIDRSNENGSESIDNIINAVIDEINEADKSTSKSFGLSLAHRKKTRAVSLLLVVSSRSISESTSLSLFCNGMKWLMDPAQQHSIKLTVEWIIALLSIAHDSVYEEVKKMHSTMAKERIGSVSSWINIVTLLSRCLSESHQESLLQLILPWTTAQNFGVRCTAIASCRFILSLLPSSSSIKHIAHSIAFFNGEPAGNSQRVIGNLLNDFYFTHLHPMDDFSLETAFYILITGTGLPLDETIPVELMETIEKTRKMPLSVKSREILKNAPSQVYNNIEKNQKCAPSIGMESIDDEEDDSIDRSLSIAPSDSVQKKIIPKEMNKRKENKSIYVVASLIDKAANLGGLCRTSEIFSVDRLIVADEMIVNDSTFKALSMSAESWQKIEEVRPDDLPEWIGNMRMNGYSIVAAEQASDSIPLHSYQFPEKMVLIMGDEKKGVPMYILRSVDSIVHIEQLGRVRSLNVHVTAALFIERYAEQHLI